MVRLSPLESLMIMVPEARPESADLDNYPKLLDFYEYYSRSAKSLGMGQHC